jgi:hypothetical protein
MKEIRAERTLKNLINIYKLNENAINIIVEVPNSKVITPEGWSG